MSEKNIADMSEAEMIEVILRMYCVDRDGVTAHKIAHHIAEKLTQRRKLIRERRRGNAKTPGQ